MNAPFLGCRHRRRRSEMEKRKINAAGVMGVCGSTGIGGQVEFGGL